MNKRFIYNILKAVLSILLIICLFNMPYGYYQLIRVVSFVLFGYFAYYEYIEKRTILFLIYLIASLIFNPIVKVALGRELWKIVDIIYAGLIIITLIVDIIKDRYITNKNN